MNTEGVNDGGWHQLSLSTWVPTAPYWESHGMKVVGGSRVGEVDWDTAVLYSEAFSPSNAAHMGVKPLVPLALSVPLGWVVHVSMFAWSVFGLTVRCSCTRY